MKKLILGLAAVAVVVALRPMLKRRTAQKMRDHCEQMATHCKEMAAQHDERGEPVVAA